LIERVCFGCDTYIYVFDNVRTLFGRGKNNDNVKKRRAISGKYGTQDKGSGGRGIIFMSFLVN
jgi:hypothetical protein